MELPQRGQRLDPNRSNRSSPPTQRGATIAWLAATRSRTARPQRPGGTEVGAAAQTTSAFSRSRENRLKCRSGLALLKSAPNDGHSHPRCGEDRHLACRLRALVGRQDARQPHSPGWLCPETVTFSTVLRGFQPLFLKTKAAGCRFYFGQHCQGPPLLVCLLLRSVNNDEYPPAGQTRGGDSLREEGDHGSQSSRYGGSRRKGVRIFDR